MSDSIDPRRLVPRTDVILGDPRLAAAAERIGAGPLKVAVRVAQDRVRSGEIGPDAVVEAVLGALPASACSLRPITNATGVVLHTNLGRAPLSAAAVEAMTLASGYVDVEFDIASGARARRGRGALDALRSAVPSAPDVLVVNNGAAALVLLATTLAAGREIVVSRGELVEIGDGFRIPDLLVSTGAQLREVGTTNRTSVDDYRAAIGPQTGFLLKVHPSNFTVQGFVHSVSVRELAQLGAPVVADIGSGLLAPDSLLPDEPDASSWLAAGAAIVTASGDKLLGGPQAGLILGQGEIVERLRRHPLARALRVDKLTLAALEATLRDPSTPTTRALHADPELLRARAEAVAAAVGQPAKVVTSAGLVGGGGAPGVELAGWAVELPVAIGERLRFGDPCIVARVERGRCLVDLRCVPPADDALVIAAIKAATGDQLLKVAAECT